MSDKILETNFDEELKKSYLAYAMSVITDRALPDARDGLKPVQRRILHAMNELGLASAGEHKKSARIVGETMGKYHPHGDSSIYDAMARLAQSFSLRVPLVDGQGNFGSIDGDSPAAMRYTEAKMAPAGELMLSDIEENTVGFVPNFDESLREPSVLPSLLPNLLINGSSGIAVGMATNIPPHNPGEVLSALSEYLGGGCSLSAEELAGLLQGPDFPTGGEIVGQGGIRELYATGRGKITLRGRASIEETKNRFIIAVTEVPFGVPKERLVNQIAEELSKSAIDGIVAVRDESDRSGNRVVVEMHKRTDPKAVLSLLYSNTSLSTTFGGNMLALVDGSPKLLTLKELFDVYIGHRREVVRGRTQYRLDRDRARLHIVEGLLKALDVLDEIIRLIRASASTKEARKGLVEQFAFSELQADAILEMRLARLTGLERDALVRENKKLRSNIAEYESILAKPKKLDSVVVKEFDQVRETLSGMGLCGRRTTIADEEPAASKKSSPGQMNLVFEKIPPSVVYAEDGYIRKKDVKRAPKDDDGLYVSGDLVYALSDDGRLYMREKKGIPGVDSRKLVSVNEYFGAEKDAKLVLLSPDIHDIAFFVTKNGDVKKMTFDAMRGDTSRKNSSKKVFPAGEGERIFRILPAGAGCDLVLVTASGKAIRIPEGTFREMGPGGGGVAGINIAEDDELADGMILAPGDADGYIAVFANGNKCSRFPAESLKPSGRGGKGMYIHRGDKPSMGRVQSISVLFPGDVLVFPSGAEGASGNLIPERGISTHTAASLGTLPEDGKWTVRREKRKMSKGNGQPDGEDQSDDPDDDGSNGGGASAREDGDGENGAEETVE